jgi:hypothetical protein
LAVANIAEAADAACCWPLLFPTSMPAILPTAP